MARLRLAYLFCFLFGVAVYEFFFSSNTANEPSRSWDSKLSLRPDGLLPSRWRSNVPPPWLPERPKAAFLVLCRNQDLGEILPTLSAIEQTVNAHPFNSYKYVVLNDVEFTPYFQTKLRSYMAEARARFGGPNASPIELEFGIIPKEHWEPPAHINWNFASLSWDRMKAQQVPYADSRSYRSMTRWFSGFFYKHDLVKDLDYVWRLEPATRYTCNLVPANGGQPVMWDTYGDGTVGDFFDPFRFMQINNKKYAFVLSLKEYRSTVHTLWPKSRDHMVKHPQYNSPNLDLLPWILTPDGRGWNMCHMWNNLMLASLDFFRSPGYQAYFDFLEKDGIFFHERPGDAPVHTIAASWLLSKDEVHQFSETLGYHHTPFHSCPQSKGMRARCACDSHQSFQYDRSQYGCQREWDFVHSINSTEKIVSYNAELGFPNITGHRLLDIPHG